MKHLACVLALSLLPFTAVTMTAESASAQSKCDAGKAKAAGKKTAAKANCHAKAYTKGVAVDPECLAKAEGKFDTAFSKAVAAGDCSSSSDAASVEALVDSCIDSYTSAINAIAAHLAACGGDTLACGDTLDNDADLLVDSEDPDCLGPCDNSESGYDPALVGVTYACNLDCFWDGGSGPGDDDCYWSHNCDPLESAPNYDPDSSCSYDSGVSIPGTASTCAQLDADQSAMCDATCGPLVPNGCDCFGCCEVVAGSGDYAWLASLDGSLAANCTAANANDPTKCRPCTPVTACLNPCDSCEVCIGTSTLAPECGGTQACTGGSTPCGRSGQTLCEDNEYCITGCCQPLP